MVRELELRSEVVKGVFGMMEIKGVEDYIVVLWGVICLFLFFFFPLMMEKKPFGAKNLNFGRFASLMGLIETKNKEKISKIHYIFISRDKY